MSTGGERPIGFGRRAVRRITDAVRRVEAQPFGGTTTGGGTRPWNPGVLDAIVTTAITKCVGTAYGVGYARVKIDDGSDNAIDDPAYPDDVRVLNWSEGFGPIAVDKHIKINWRNGKFSLVSGDCP